jgi:hypothetical protein
MEGRRASPAGKPPNLGLGTPSRGAEAAAADLVELPDATPWQRWRAQYAALMRKHWLLAYRNWKTTASQVRVACH